MQGRKSHNTGLPGRVFLAMVLILGTVLPVYGESFDQGWQAYQAGDYNEAVRIWERQGRLRMTLTYPVLNRARCVLWVITGAEKRAMLSRLYRGDTTIPAGRVRAQQTILVTDQAAAEGLNSAGS